MRMRPNLITTLLVSLLLTIPCEAVPVSENKTKVILVSMDGFRHDYLTKTDTPNFDTMIENGVTMSYMNNTFITLTFPNHYTIATGNYEESHGIVANSMYDPVYNDTFHMSTTEERWWSSAEPIWVTAKKNGRKVGVYFWPGSVVPHENITADESPAYNGSIKFEDRVDGLVSWMSERDYDLGLLYFDEPDHTGHYHGPDGPEIVEQIERMDRILGYLVKRLKEANLFDKVNLIVTADHGMASVNTSDHDRLIDVSDYVNSSLLLEVVQQGPAAHLRPQPGKGQQLVDALQNISNMTVMLKEDIPEDKHYKNNRRVTDVFAMADDGFQITGNRTKRLKYAFLGDHGFDDDNLKMRPIFVARGPDFKSGDTVAPIKNVDIYPLICHLLDMQPAPNNGSLSRVKTLLRSKRQTSVTSTKEPNSGHSNHSNPAHWVLGVMATFTLLCNSLLNSL